MKYGSSTLTLAAGAFVAFLGAAFAKDDLFEAHMWVLFFVLLGSMTIALPRSTKNSTHIWASKRSS